MVLLGNLEDVLFQHHHLELFEQTRQPLERQLAYPVQQLLPLHLGFELISGHDDVFRVELR
jgi:hypothetical protein